MSKKLDKKARRVKRKAKRQNRFVVPRFVACHYSPAGKQPTAEQLLDALRVGMVLKQETCKPMLPFLNIGNSLPNQCWHNVAKVVEEHGGRPVYGWHVNIAPMPGVRNSLAELELIPHCVWEDPQGVHWEVSPDAYGKPFMPSDCLEKDCIFNVGFLDNEFQASTYRSNDPFSVSSANLYMRVPA